MNAPLASAARLWLWQDGWQTLFLDWKPEAYGETFKIIYDDQFPNNAGILDPNTGDEAWFAQNMDVRPLCPCARTS